ncbi:oocyte zinc finger protein XlCOF6-like [Culex pipiens pallens]|uniref:oocyte zinc finger protein XlCOF6-like n=1 Tax=Culex pipiens pallens TaxID=42434 RepID=UPI00195309AD|nr:oocyte zinc finger protein XlCOF6-like [Culex pipiens pallens]
MDDSLNTTPNPVMGSHEDEFQEQSASEGPEDDESPTEDNNSSKIYSCDRCPKRYVQLAHLQSHQKYCKTPLEKVESKTQMCHLCPAKFKKTAEFRYHMLKHNGETPYGCRSEGCTKGFHSPKARLAHEKKCGREQQSGPGEVVCDVCGAVFKSANALTQHALSHREPSHECHICSEKFVRKGKLGSHYRKKHKVEPPWKKEAGDGESSEEEDECGDCGRVFDSATNLRMHRKFCKATAGVLTCEQCGRVFTDKARFGYHMNQHNDVRPFECQIEGCTKSFFSPDTRKKHHRVCGKSDKPIECTVCGAKLKTSDSLRTHMQTHSTGPRPTCHICGQEFTMKGNLREHLNRHANGTLKGTRVKATLKCKSRYQKREESSDEDEPKKRKSKRKATAESTPEQPDSVFEVDEVKQEIVEEEIIVTEHQVPPESDLPLNQRTKRPKRARAVPTSSAHKCTECEATFTKAHSLKNHMQVHSKRRYECTVCGKKLLKQTSLDVHMQSHERKNADKSSDSLEIHSCDDCCKSFVDLRALEAYRVDCEKIGAPLATSGSYCHLCPAAFQDADQLRLHLGEHDDELEDNRLKCRREGCEERFSNCGDLWEHEARCEEVGHFVCDICAGPVEEFDELRRHEEAHLEQAASCRICGETFYSETDSEHHWRTHFGEALPGEELPKDANWRLMESMPESTHCELCSKGFVTELVLRLHRQFCEQRF